MRIAFFGSSLVSAYWNGAATYYRGIIRALAERGHRITFYEPDAYGRQEHRDIDDPDWAEVVVYPADREGVGRALDRARGADLVVKASGVGVFDELLEEAVTAMRSPTTLAAFWDVDAPATLQRVGDDPADPFRALIPQYDLVLTYGGGPPVVAAYEGLGARRCVPIYNALDPETHHPVAPDPRFTGTLGFLGNRLPDREARVEEFFLRAAERTPGQRFLLGGSGWGDRTLPDNIRYLGHVYTADHNAFNCTPRAVLNISRDSMAETGFSPATRVFEAAGAGACLITDAWEGIEEFLEPDREVLVARDGGEVCAHLNGLTPEHARQIGERARQRMLREHTYTHRAVDVEAALGVAGAGKMRSSASAGRMDGESARGRAEAEAEAEANAKTDADGEGGTDGELAQRLRLVFLGLSITSSWGNGHATTYRGLVRELCRRGHQVLFLERDVPWYASQRDLPDPPYGETRLYRSPTELRKRWEGELRDADAVIVGSYVPDGIEVATEVLDLARGVTAFYDIDTPVTLAAVDGDRCEYLDRSLIPRFDLYLSFTGGPTLQRLERELGARRAEPLYCSVDPDHYAPGPRVPEILLSYMGTYSDDRQPAVERLILEPARQLPGQRFAVVGPQYPDDIDWPPNVERIDHLAPARHPGFYNRSLYTLNITRRDMISAGHAPSVRLFEAAACATPIISDSWPGIETFFEPGAEIFLVESSDDVFRILRGTSAERRRAVGERARRRVLGAHTSSHRAAELEAYVLSELRGRREESHGIDRSTRAGAAHSRAGAVVPQPGSGWHADRT